MSLVYPTRGDSGLSAPDGAASMGRQWVTEYSTDWYADHGTVDFMPLTGSTWTDAFGVVWDVTAPAALPNFGIAAAGWGSSGASSSGTVEGRMLASIAELVAAGGGPAYNNKLDVVDIFAVYPTITLAQSSQRVGAAIMQHSGAFRSDRVGRSAGANWRETGEDDNTSAYAASQVAGGFAAGIIAWRVVGCEVGTAYSTDIGAALDFGAFSTFAAKRYLSPAVRVAAGDDDGSSPTIQLDIQHVAAGVATLWMSHFVVKRYRGRGES